MQKLSKFFLLTLLAPHAMAAPLKYTQEWVGTETVCATSECTEMFHAALLLVARFAPPETSHVFNVSENSAWKKSRLVFVHTTTQSTESQKRFGQAGEAPSFTYMSRPASGQKREFSVGIYWDQILPLIDQKSEGDAFALLVSQLAYELYGVVGPRVMQSWEEYINADPIPNALFAFKAANQARGFLNRVIDSKERFVYASSIRHFRRQRPVAEGRFTDATRHFRRVAPCESRIVLGIRSPGRPPGRR